METKQRLMLANLTGAFLFVPVLYSFITTLLSERRGPGDAPDWISYSRGILIVASIVVPALAHFTARQFERLSRGHPPQQQLNLEFIAFVAGLALFQTPGIISLISFIGGAPAADVYLFSAYSFLGVLFWSWYNRALFRVSSRIPCGDPEKEPESVHAISFLRSFTIVLILLGTVASLFLAVKIFVVAHGLAPESRSVSMDTFLVLLYIFIVIGCWTAVILRARRSQYALAATGVITPVLLTWIPLGTLAFVYWIGWIRKKEPRYRS